MKDKTTQKDLTLLKQAFNEIQMPRTPYILENMVVNSKFTNEQRYAQCVLELSIAYDNLRLAKLGVELKQIEIKEITGKDRKSQIARERKQIEQEQTERAMLGAMREFEYLYDMWCKFPKKYTRDEINMAQPKEFLLRLETQAAQDKSATGRVLQGNQEGLRQIGRPVTPELDFVREVEKNYLEKGNQKIIIAVATEEKADKGLPCIEGLLTPAGVQIKYFNSWGRTIDDSYNCIVQEGLKDSADFILTVEDDTFPQANALIKLFELIKKHPKTAVGAWYPKREIGNPGVHIVLKEGVRQPLGVDGEIHEVYTLAMGCSLYPVEMFRDIPFPWFQTTPNLSQDSFLSQQARDRGWKLLVDTSIQCKHIDRNTKLVHEFKAIPDAMQIPEELEAILAEATGKKLILEIGTATGGTLYRIMKVADSFADIVSIDLPGGKFGGEFGQPEPKLMASWLKDGQQLHLIRQDSKAFKTVEQVKYILNGRKFDFVFIDGDHSYEGVKQDYEIYKEFAADIIIFHDIAEHDRADVGVRRFWQELNGNKTEIIKDEKQGWAGVGILRLN